MNLCSWVLSSASAGEPCSMHLWEAKLSRRERKGDALKKL